MGDHGVYEGGKINHNVEDLKDAIQKVWEESEIELITDLIKSFPKRLIQIIEAKVGPTKNYGVSFCIFSGVFV